jgi:hypothetical protein
MYSLRYAAQMAWELAAGNSNRTPGEIERAFARTVEISAFQRLGRGSGTRLAHPARSADPPSHLGPAAMVVHARYPSAYKSALHLQLEAWEDGSYRLTFLRREGPAAAKASAMMARRLAERFERLVSEPALELPGPVAGG